MLWYVCKKEDIRNVDAPTIEAVQGNFNEEVNCYIDDVIIRITETDKNASFETYLRNSDKCFEFRIVTLCENGLSDKEKAKIKENFKNYFYNNSLFR